MLERDLFIEALQRELPAEREAYLVSACGGDAALRQRVEDLLKAHYNQESFLLDRLPCSAGDTLAQEIFEKDGMQVGPYKLLQQIGEGGFGVVFMAEQTQPVQRRVALKVIKPGMDTRQVIARFEAERQALAVMDHPNIARVLEAGTTVSGRPYFVMELVRGLPITTFCDENNLAIRERLELFATVCQGIQHAHTKGIIHRDIKPSNVLVTRQDGGAIVKVIDFGVAKAIGQQLTEKTLFTAYAQMIGTPLYMSPEQAELSSLDIDTRSDIYSLGVLLHSAPGLRAESGASLFTASREGHTFMLRRHLAAALMLAILNVLGMIHAAAIAGDDIPFNGTLTGSLVSRTPINPPVVFDVFEIEGQANHLGTFELVLEAEVNFGTSPPTATGTLTFTAANGDELVADFTGSSALVVPGLVLIIEHATIDPHGSTGRFAGATGSFTVERLADAATGVNGVTECSFTGTITLAPGR